MAALSLSAVAAPTVEFIAGLRAEDGDSLISPAGEKMRLLCIDAPEYQQDNWQAAKKVLQEMVRNGARVHRMATDRYGRTLVIVKVGDDSGGDARVVNVEMVRRGAAWVYRRYAATCGIPARLLYQAEKEARTARRGLWQNDNPLPSWEWRRRQEAAGKTP